MLTLDEAIKNCEEVASRYGDKDFRQIAEWLTDYKRLKSIETPEEIGLLKLQVQNWLGGLEISKSIMTMHDCNTDELDEHIEILKTVVAVLERIKA